jgi:transposase
MTLLSTISNIGVISNQILAGKVDTTLIVNYLEETFYKLRKDPHFKDKQILLFWDNATIHKGVNIHRLCLKYKIHVLYNAAYSPQLNPIEIYFKHLKEMLHNIELSGP